MSGARSESGPLVSVLVRSTDRSTLTEALDSVAAQTYRNIEIVVVDAAGTHRSLPSKWDELPLRLVALAAPRTRPRAANAALEAARGDWLLFLDDDDLLMPEHVERLVSAARLQGKASAPYAGVRVIDADGKTVDIYDYADAAARLSQHNPFPIHAVLFPRWVVDAGVRFDEDLMCFEDWDFWRQVSLRLQFVHVPGVSAIYRAALGDSGISLAINATERERGRHAVLERWLPRMSPQEFDALLARQRDQLEQAAIEVGAQRHRANDLLQKIAELETEAGKQRMRLLQTEAEAGKQRHRADDLHNQVEQLRVDMAVMQTELNRQLSDALQRAERLSESVANLQSTLTAMRNSRSWRITRPLRALGSGLRRLRAVAVLAQGSNVTERGVDSVPVTSLAAPSLTADLTRMEVLSPPERRRAVSILVGPNIDAENSSGVLARLRDDDRLYLVADSSAGTCFPTDPRVIRLSGVGGQLGEAMSRIARAERKDGAIVLVSDVPIPDETALGLISATFETASNVATVSPAVTWWDVLGVPLDDVTREALGRSDVPWLRWPAAFAALIADWPGPRGPWIAFRNAALRELGSPDDTAKDLKSWGSRAVNRGWRHAAAPAAAPKMPSASTASPTVQAGDRAWADFAARPDVFSAAFDLKLERLLFSGRPSVMILDHNFGGGANRYRRQCIERWLAQERAVLLYYEDLFNRRGMAVLNHPTIGAFERPGVSTEALEHLAGAGAWDEIFFNNAAHAQAPLGVPSLLARLKKITGARLTFAVHDFYTVCPTFVLLDDAGKHCGVPDEIQDCERCLARNRFDPHAGRFTIRDWRAAWGAALDAADQIVCFSNSSATLLARAYPGALTKTTVEPHRTPPWPAGTTVPLDWTGGLRIGVVGGLYSEAKGSRVVANLIDVIRERRLDIPVVLIGEMIDMPKPAGLLVTGRYLTEELPTLLAQHGINFCFFPSICPETFSYVLSELMGLNMPICGFDLGAQGERLRAYERGLVVDRVDAAVALNAMLAWVESHKAGGTVR